MDRDPEESGSRRARRRTVVAGRRSGKENWMRQRKQVWRQVAVLLGRDPEEIDPTG